MSQNSGESFAEEQQQPQPNRGMQQNLNRQQQWNQPQYVGHQPNASVRPAMFLPPDFVPSVPPPQFYPGNPFQPIVQVNNPAQPTYTPTFVPTPQQPWIQNVAPYQTAYGGQVQGYLPNMPTQTGFGTQQFNPQNMIYTGFQPTAPQHQQMSHQPTVGSYPQFQHSFPPPTAARNLEFQPMIPNPNPSNPQLLVPMSYNPGAGKVVVGYIPVVEDRTFNRRSVDNRLNTTLPGRRFSRSYSRNAHSRTFVCRGNENEVSAVRSTPADIANSEHDDEIPNAERLKRDKMTAVKEKGSTPTDIANSEQNEAISNDEKLKLDTSIMGKVPTAAKSHLEPTAKGIMEIASPTVKSKATGKNASSASLTEPTVEKVPDSIDLPHANVDAKCSKSASSLDRTESVLRDLTISESSHPTTSTSRTSRATSQTIKELCGLQVQSESAQHPPTKDSLDSTEFKPVAKNKSFDISTASTKFQLAIRTAIKRAAHDARTSNQPPTVDENTEKKNLFVAIQSSRKSKKTPKKMKKTAVAEDDEQVFREAAVYNMSENINNYIEYRKSIRGQLLDLTGGDLQDQQVRSFERFLVRNESRDVTEESVEKKNNLCIGFLTDLDLGSDWEWVNEHDKQDMKLFFKLLAQREESVIVSDVISVFDMTSPGSFEWFGHYFAYSTSRAL